MNIYLLGFRAAGKSTLLQKISISGKKIDLDAELARDFGESVLHFSQRQGIEEFRKREFAKLSQLEMSQSTSPSMIAMGGGFVDWPASRELLLKSPSQRVFLRTPAALLWERLKDQPERLIVGGIESYEAFLALYERRQPHFEQLATKVIENTGMESSQAEIERWLFSALGFMK